MGQTQLTALDECRKDLPAACVDVLMRLAQHILDAETQLDESFLPFH
jgi:hypothetical protein